VGGRGTGGVIASGDGGQAASLVLVVVTAVGLVVAAALGDVGRAVVDRQRARTAADAAALAGVLGGRGAAVELARRHGGALVGWEVGPGPGEVTVVVRLGDARVVARATDSP
jgi:hypothetical protein